MATLYTAPWTPDPDEERRFRSSVTAVTFALTHPDLTQVHRKRLLHDTLWYLLEGDKKGDWRPVRYRSKHLVESEPDESRRDHVVTRQRLIAELLAAPDQAEMLLRKNVACLATKEEHARIGRFDKTHYGWGPIPRGWHRCLRHGHPNARDRGRAICQWRTDRPDRRSQ